MAQAIVLSGGVGHPFGQATPVLLEILEQAGFSTRSSDRVDEVLGWLRQDAGALLVVYALRWSMTQHERFAAERASWSVDLTAAERELIAGHVSQGSGLLGIHTASICFDTWGQWRDVLGGAWVWGRSNHPAWGPVETRMNPQHVLTRGLEPWSSMDEVYSELDLAPDIDVAMWARAVPALAPGAAPLAEQPSVWTHGYGRGRVVYSGLGHDAASLRHPIHQRLLRRAALWASGVADKHVEAV
jgi:type 1 glutamine amidotransferase